MEPEKSQNFDQEFEKGEEEEIQNLFLQNGTISNR